MTLARLGERLRFGWRTASLLAVALALAVALVLVLLEVRALSADEEDRDAALAAARSQARAFTTIDYREVDDSLDRVLAGATGEFAEQFEESRDDIAIGARQNQSVSRGDIVSAGVVSLTDDRAQVIVVVDGEVSNISTEEPQPRFYRLQLELVRESDRWLTSQLEFVG
ncbi:MAG: hypothetical protein Q8Q02_07795 [Nocardioides sp.]|nr:hypothetical protein [Nocardioides sp.]